jgi:hypothetical protein
MDKYMALIFIIVLVTASASSLLCYKIGYGDGVKTNSFDCHNTNQAGYMEGFKDGYNFNKSKGLDKYHAIMINDGYDWMIKKYKC